MTQNITLEDKYKKTLRDLLDHAQVIVSCDSNYKVRKVDTLEATVIDYTNKTVKNEMNTSMVSWLFFPDKVVIATPKVNYEKIDFDTYKSLKEDPENYRHDQIVVELFKLLNLPSLHKQGE